MTESGFDSALTSTQLQTCGVSLKGASKERSKNLGWSWEILLWGMTQNMHPNSHYNGSTTFESSFKVVISVPWPKAHWKPVELAEEERRVQNGGPRTLKGLERFFMEEWSQIACSVFSSLIKHCKVPMVVACSFVIKYKFFDKVQIRLGFSPIFSVRLSKLITNYLIFIHLYQ